MAESAVLEECDDGNIINVDGCNELCLLEPMWACTDESGGAFDPSAAEDTAVTPMDDVCTFSCIESMVEHAGADYAEFYKECDDGNMVIGDGCNDWCFIETGWELDTIGTMGGTLDTFKEICGDGLDFGSYACDDGNTVSGDGCDLDCNLETGFTCQFGKTLAPDLCYEECHGPAGGAIIGTISDGGQWPC